MQHGCFCISIKKFFFLDIRVDLAHLHRPCRKHLDTKWTIEAEDAVGCQREGTENEKSVWGQEVMSMI